MGGPSEHTRCPVQGDCSWAGAGSHCGPGAEGQRCHPVQRAAVFQPDSCPTRLGRARGGSRYLAAEPRSGLLSATWPKSKGTRNWDFMILPSNWKDPFEPMHVFLIKPNCETNTTTTLLLLLFPLSFLPLSPPPPRTTEPSSHMVVDHMGRARKGTPSPLAQGGRVQGVPSQPTPHQ